MKPFPLRALALSVSLVAAAQAHAAPIAVDLPAQSLESALQQLGQASGLQVVYEPAAVAGKRAPAVSGRMEPKDALQRLLAGSDLAGAVQGNVLSVTGVSSGDAMQLGATTVSAAGTGPSGLATTEGTGSYTTGRMSTSTKLPLSIRETPQSVTVVTRQRMDDQNMTDLNDVVKATTGVIVNYYGPERVSYMARGFTVDNLMYDGLPTDVSTYTQDVVTGADSVMFDRVEVVRGATGLMQGAGNPSAAINMVRKKPTADVQASVSASAGNWDRYRTEVDVSGPLNQEGTVRGRLATAYQDGNSFQDYVKRERGAYYGVIEADLNDATTLTVSSSYQNDNKNNNWTGLPLSASGTDLHQSRSTYVGPDWAYWNTDNTQLFTGLEHRFDNGWKINLSMNKMWARIHMLGAYSYYNDDALTFGGGNYIYTDDHSSYDAFASGPFQLFGREHELVIGTSYREEQFDGHGGFGEATEQKPSYDLNGWALKTDNKQIGTYVTSRFNLADDLKLIIGSRLDWYEGNNETANTQLKENRHVTRYAGLIYDINDTYSVYTSFTDIFKPQSVLGADNSYLKPIVGKSYEVGVKGEYFDGALNAGAALFLVNQENRAVDDTSGPFPCPNGNIGSPNFCQRASGEVQSKGIDLDVSGAITENWQASAGYTYAHVVYKKDADNQGDRFNPEMPQHLFKLNTSYRFPDQKWRVGGTVTAQTNTYPSGYTTFQQSGYAVFDAMLGYKVNEHIDTRVNFNNILDKTYYSGVGFASLNYGDPRNMMFTVKWSL
jgi:outer membrane receptor for ferric coprogen and ferric-rhodotorulic acid